MEKFQNVIKVCINTLMTLILIIGAIFIILYVIGIEPFVVESGSMQPAIETGSLSFVNKKAKYESIRPQDIIAFKVKDTGIKVTHRVISVSEEGMETKGDANEVSDGISTTRENYIGKTIFSIPKIGYIVKILQTPRGKVILGTVIIVLVFTGILIEDPKKKKSTKI